MRLGLQHEQACHNEQVIAQGKTTLPLNFFAQDVFRLGTIQLAQAIHMEDQVGSIEVGKLADLITFDGTSPGMVYALNKAQWRLLPYTHWFASSAC